MVKERSRREDVGAVERERERERESNLYTTAWGLR